MTSDDRRPSSQARGQGPGCMSAGLRIVRADYSCPSHRRDLVALLDAYARDPAGGGAPLGADVRDRVVDGLARCAHAFSLLCYVDDKAVGLVNCIGGYSTFAARPLVNVHDIMVLAPYRGREIATRMLAQVEAIARERGCCKLTLEVLEGNAPARRAYARFGFESYALDPAMGHAVFLQKSLPDAAA